MKNGRALAQQLVDSLSKEFGSRLECAVLYGSVARDEAIDGVSDVNVMLLLDDLHAATLGQAAPAAQRWARAGHTPPLIMEREQWARAADVFAIELADMRDAHIVLHGQDCVGTGPIPLADLRIQAERELRGKLLQLQTGMLMSDGDPKQLGELLKEALPSFATYLRAVIRLARQTVPTSMVQVIRQGMQVVGGTPDALLTVWEARVHKQGLRLTLRDPLVENYHAAAEQTADYVDNLREVGE
ncbi:MAG: hypothetical protein ACRENP_25095 [Longimicrobiales bacterium]